MRVSDEQLWCLCVYMKHVCPHTTHTDLLGCWVFLQRRHIFSERSSCHAACSRTWSCCCLASSICCLCFSICEAASFFCSSWAARSCSLRLLNWPIMPMSWRSFSARLSGVPTGRESEEGGGGRKGQRWEGSTLKKSARLGWGYAMKLESLLSTTHLHCCSFGGCIK